VPSLVRHSKTEFSVGCLRAEQSGGEDGFVPARSSFRTVHNSVFVIGIGLNFDPCALDDAVHSVAT
jgi:hypothetical protein